MWYGDGVGDYCSVTWPLPLTVQREGRGGDGGWGHNVRDQRGDIL